MPPISDVIPGFRADAWFATVAPPRTPAALTETLSAAIGEIIRSPEVADRLRALSATPVGASPAETGAFIRQESERWRKVIVAAGIKAE